MRILSRLSRLLRPRAPSRILPMDPREEKILGQIRQSAAARRAKANQQQVQP